MAQSILRHAVHGAAETLYELYYRFAITHALYLTPDLQFISNPAGDSNADFTVVLGLRLRILAPVKRAGSASTSARRTAAR